MSNHTLKPWLVFENVEQRYQAVNVIAQMSFVLKRGEIACLLGSSGCGKTTVLRCIAGFEKIVAGSIHLNSQLISAVHYHQPAHRRQVGMVFQDYALLPHLTVAGNIGLGLHALTRQERQRRIANMLEMIGLMTYAKRYPHELSGGQQQRVALARALAVSPSVLLMDEPFSNLDVDLRERLSRDVRTILKQQSITAIMVTHDQQEAFAVADKVGVMHQGRLLQWGSPYELYHDPSSRYVAEFIGKGTFLPAKVLGKDEVEFELGRYRGKLPASLNCGNQINLLLRPDDLVYDQDSRLALEVIDKVFLGEMFHYTLRLPSGATVLAKIPSHCNSSVGEKIGVRLEMDHLIAFSA